MSKSQKILHFLQYIDKNKSFCVAQMAAYLDISVKSVQRYIKEIEEFFGFSFLHPAKGCYALPDTSKINEIFVDAREIEQFEKLIDIVAIADSSFVKFLGIDGSLAKKLLKEDASIYLLKESPFEELVNFHLLQKLKSAIKYHQFIDISYHSDKNYFFEYVKPIKILYAQGNWYLAAITKDSINNGFKFLRINFIQDIIFHRQTFQKDYEAEYFLQNFQSLFSAYKEPFFDVVVEVDEEVARHFRVKKFLPSQKIIKDEGKLLIKYTINIDNEILMLAKQWLPHMKIVSPYFLQEKLIKIVEDFLNDKN